MNQKKLELLKAKVTATLQGSGGHEKGFRDALQSVATELAPELAPELESTDLERAIAATMDAYTKGAKDESISLDYTLMDEQDQIVAVDTATMTQPQASDILENALHAVLLWRQSYQIDNTMAQLEKALVAAGVTVVKPGAGNESTSFVSERIVSIKMQDLVGDYDAPTEVPEWQWVERHATFSHLRNGKNGIWEFTLNLSGEFEDVPAKLQATFQRAREDKVAYLIFHQGT